MPLSSAVEPVACRTDELVADRLVHLIGLGTGIIAALALTSIAAETAHRQTFCATLIYSLSLVTLLLCSTVYNFSPGSRHQRLLRRFDHAAIFLLIAGTYTPFTVCRLHGMWSIGMTATMWTAAAVGAASVLCAGARSTAAATVAYLGLGWLGLVALRPLLASVDPATALLVGTGGVIYSIGAGVHLRRSLRFCDAIWHMMVMIAAACQYAAILHGVVLAGS